MERVNVLIAGGGIIGSAVAYCLALRGVKDIQVVDLDLAGVYASSELNAGGVRATWWQPVNIETCRRSLDFFRSQRERFGFRERGYLWLYADRELFDVGVMCAVFGVTPAGFYAWIKRPRSARRRRARDPAALGQAHEPER